MEKKACTLEFLKMDALAFNDDHKVPSFKIDIKEHLECYCLQVGTTNSFF